MQFAMALLTEITKTDIASSDWWAQQFSSFTPANVALVLAMGVALGAWVALVYRLTYRGVLYSPLFSTTLIMLTLVTAPVVMAIGSNVALSMGMVGALSIVRFRTAVKEPLDTAYMFWAITTGILLGAQQYMIAVVVAAGIGIIMIFLSYIGNRGVNAFLLVVHCDKEAEADIENELKRLTRIHRMRSKTVTRAGVEMTVEVRLGSRGDLVGRILEIAGVHDATLVSCQNETGA